ncbi:MAG: hypothetical protein M1600_02480, partial [Firmicutes bacterium]|nr:hypothetical protein [Bacillota bacterium]
RLFPPTDIPSERIVPAIWRYTQMVWSDLCQIIKGWVDLRDWKAPQRWKRHLHERPRKRRYQCDSA